MANILEIFTLKDDKTAIQKLLDLAEKYSADNGLGRLELIACSMQVARSARLNGYIGQELQMPACIYKLSGRGSGGVDNWYISSGDGDTAMYPAII